MRESRAWMRESREAIVCVTRGQETQIDPTDLCTIRVLKSVPPIFFLLLGATDFFNPAVTNP
ncbi:uncharacterized protein DS421_6g194400 [Arachis hypogaea]|nr:uncharacterized protein DS421_6g194400 [Arachis hypogaea]